MLREGSFSSLEIAARLVQSLNGVSQYHLKQTQSLSFSIYF